MSNHEVGNMSDGNSSITSVDSSVTSKPPSTNKHVHERTPLITPDETRDNATSPDDQSKQKTPQAIVVALVLLLVLAAVSDQLSEAPHVRIMEAVLCYRHFEVADPSKILLSRSEVGPGAIGGVDEMWCKIESVQSPLAMLQGYQTLFDGFPSLLLALPFGWAADKYGRKPILVLGILSFFVRMAWIQMVLWFWQSFDIRWIWLSAAHGLMAGSSPVVSALLYTVIADVAPANDRSALFARLGASNLIPSAFVPLIAAWLMTRDPWIPALAGTASVLLCMPLVLLIPETLNYRHPNSTPSSSRPQSPTIEAIAAPPDPSTNPNSISFNFAGRWTTAARSSLSFLWADWRIPVLISSFVLHMLTAQVYPLLLQYTSKRYELEFSTATKVLTVRSVLNCVFLLLILPWTSRFVMNRWNLSAQRKDLYLARTSLLLISVGWISVGASPVVALAVVSLCITCLGAGAMYLIRGFLTSLVPAHHVARVYSLISVVDTVGVMLGAPFLAALLSRGLAIGGLGIGLPFFFLGGASLVLFLLVCVIGMRKGESEGYQSVEQDE